MRFTYWKSEESGREYSQTIAMNGKSIYNVRDYGYITRNDVDVFCLANESADFELVTKYRCANYLYRSSIISGRTKKPYEKVACEEYGQEQMAKACYPDGVQVKCSLSDVPKSITEGFSVSQYIYYHVVVSRTYAEAINKQFETIFTNHKDTISVIVNEGIKSIQLKAFGISLGDVAIEIKHDGVRFRHLQSNVILTKIPFDSLGFANLPNDVYQFAMAKAVAKEVVNQQRDQLEFEEVIIHYSAFGQQECNRAAETEIVFKVKPYNHKPW